MCIHTCTIISHNYTFQESFFEPEFLSIVRYCKQGDSSPEGLLDLLTEEKSKDALTMALLFQSHCRLLIYTVHISAPNVFSFPVLTGAFCDLLMEELEHFEQSEVPKGRPNTMNKGGVSAWK